jgi:hypothetical protein
LSPLFGKNIQIYVKEKPVFTVFIKHEA